MNWVADLWRCPECGVAVQEMHTDGCAMRNVTATAVWWGPPATPGMLPRMIVEGDLMVHLRMSCLFCEKTFEVGDVVFENRQQTMSIHGACVLALAAVVPRLHPNVADVEAEFERRRAELENG